MSINPKAIRGPVTAVPVVAGKGIRFVEDVENNRVVAEVDETVLWEGTETLSTNQEITLSEFATNFERIRVYGESWNTWSPVLWGEILMTTRGNAYHVSLATSYLGSNGAAIRFVQAVFEFNDNKMTVTNAGLFSIQGTAVASGSPSNTLITKIIGINRIANN